MSAPLEPSDPAYRPVSRSDTTLPPPPQAPAAAVGGSRQTTLLLIFLVGAAVSVGLGVYGRVHEPTLIAVNLAGFSGPLPAKAWLTSGAALFALVQLVSALALYGKLGLSAPSWTGTLHRWSGRVAFLLAVPVAIHCLYALGFESASPRVLIHSLLGCFFFGAFTAKMLLLTRKGMPGWALPLLGGAAFTGLAGLWLTSALWFFSTTGVTF
ncbi:MAG TPA: DUF6529 family protein [Micromonosporaceae bacterium]